MARLGPVLVTLVALTLPAFLLSGDALQQTTFTVSGDGSMATLRFDARPIDPLSPTEVFVSNGAEPAILVDKLGRSILIGDQLGVLRSTNGGANWARLSVPYIPGNHPAIGGIYDGWTLAQDDAGKIYASTTDGAVINVATSIDGGATWQQGLSTYVVDAGGIADRPWLAARGNGQVAVTWNAGGLGVQRCDYSTDGGLTFTQRTAPAFLGGNGIPIGGLPAWMSNGHLVYAGNGFATAATLYKYPSPPCGTSVTTIPLPSHGAQMSTQVATDAGNKIYVATPTNDNSGMQIIGFNGFQTVGSKTIVVSPPTLKGNTFSTIASRPGEIAVGWYGTTTPGDFTNPSFEGSWNVYVARVRDFWTASPQVTFQQVTTTPNHVGDFCFEGTNCDVGNPGDRDLLDYWQLTYDAAGNLHLAYGHDGATSNAEVRYTMLPSLG